MTYSHERDDALAQEAMALGDYNSMATRQYADAHGSVDTAAAWILTPFDSWERNPHYVGPAMPHPEDWTDELEAQLYSDEFSERDDFDEIPY